MTNPKARILVRLLDVCRLAAVREEDDDTVTECTQTIQALQDAQYVDEFNDSVLKALTIIEAYVDTRKEA